MRFAGYSLSCAGVIGVVAGVLHCHYSTLPVARFVGLEEAVDVICSYHLYPQMRQNGLCVTMIQHLRKPWLTALVHLGATTKG